MKQCPNCRNDVIDEATFCPVCGTALNFTPGYDPDFHPHAPEIPSPMPVYVPPVPVKDPHDHTEEFIAEDIAENKLVCMLVYLLDVVGIIIALLASGASEYTHFHIRQAMKFTILEILLSIASAVLCWTFIVPFLGMAAMVTLFVLKAICFVQVCNGKAKDAAIIRSFGFLN